MTDKSWSKTERIFTDRKNDLRLKIVLAHGGAAIRALVSPTTEGDVYILPNDGESIPALASRLGVGVTPDREGYFGIRVCPEGIALGIKINTKTEAIRFEESLHKPEQVVNVLMQKLEALKKSVAPEVIKDIRDFLNTTLLPQAVKNADAGKVKR